MHAGTHIHNTCARKLWLQTGFVSVDVEKTELQALLFCSFLILVAKSQVSCGNWKADKWDPTWDGLHALGAQTSQPLILVPVSLWAEGVMCSDLIAVGKPSPNSVTLSCWFAHQPFTQLPARTVRHTSYSFREFVWGKTSNLHFNKQNYNPFLGVVSLSPLLSFFLLPCPGSLLSGSASSAFLSCSLGKLCPGACATTAIDSPAERFAARGRSKVYLWCCLWWSPSAGKSSSSCLTTPLPPPRPQIYTEKFVPPARGLAKRPGVGIPEGCFLVTACPSRIHIQAYTHAHSPHTLLGMRSHKPCLVPREQGSRTVREHCSCGCAFQGQPFGVHLLFHLKTNPISKSAGRGVFYILNRIFPQTEKYHLLAENNSMTVSNAFTQAEVCGGILRMKRK